MLKQKFTRGLFLLMLFLSMSAFLPVMAQNLIADPGFEAGTPNPSWVESSTNFGTPLCTIGSCGTGLGTGPHTGSWWAWFGGISAYEAGEMSQSLVIPNGTANLSFWLEIPVSSGNGSDYLTVEIDGNTIATFLESTPGYLTYTQVTLDVSAYADGNSHNVKFYSEIFGPTTTNFFVDDVELIATQAPPAVPIQPWSILLAVGLIAGVVFFRFFNIR